MPYRCKKTNLGGHIHGLLLSLQNICSLFLVSQFDFVQIQWLFGECSRVFISVARNVALARAGTLCVGFWEEKPQSSMKKIYRHFQLIQFVYLKTSEIFS